MTNVVLDGCSLTLDDVVVVARHGGVVSLLPEARKRMETSHAWVAGVTHMPVYGVNTGYGSLARVRIDSHQISELSWNLVRSHAAGVGPEVALPAVRAMMLLRANALAKGASGCRPVLVERLNEMLNAGVTPIVPSRGSCGSSGDLAPLAHLGLVVFRGEDGTTAGRALYRGERLDASEAMASAGLQQLVPGPKEGLAMTNGAQLTCAIAALACWDAIRLVKTAEIAAAMSWEALRGVTRALHPEVHRLRPFPGAIACAANLRDLMGGSTLTDSIPEKVQDAYSIRCTPQILGAVRDALRYCVAQVEVELNAVTDNPVILVDEADENKAFSAGLFHGEPVGFAADHLKLALCEVAAVSERRLYRLTTEKLSATLPPMLRQGPHLGLVIPQTSAAALVSENRQLAWPASVDSIPTCEDQEDIVAMSTTASRRAAEVLANSQQVVAIELLVAAHALWLRQKEDPHVQFGAGTAAALASVEAVLGGREPGGAPADDMAILAKAIREGTVLDAVESAMGPLRGVR